MKTLFSILMISAVFASAQTRTVTVKANGQLVDSVTNFFRDNSNLLNHAVSTAGSGSGTTYDFDENQFITVLVAGQPNVFIKRDAGITNPVIREVLQSTNLDARLSGTNTALVAYSVAQSNAIHSLLLGASNGVVAYVVGVSNSLIGYAVGESNALVAFSRTVGAAATNYVNSKFSGLTASVAVMTDGSGNLAASFATSDDLNNIQGLTGGVQSQLNSLVGMLNSWTASGSNYALTVANTVGLNGTNNVNARGTESTNFARGTIGGDATNFSQTIGLNTTGHVNAASLALTNRVLAVEGGLIVVSNFGNSSSLVLSNNAAAASASLTSISNSFLNVSNGVIAVSNLVYTASNAFDTRITAVVTADTAVSNAFLLVSNAVTAVSNLTYSASNSLDARITANTTSLTAVSNAFIIVSNAVTTVSNLTFTASNSINTRISNGWIMLQPQAAKLPSTNGAVIDGGWQNWELNYPKTNASGTIFSNSAIWQVVMPRDYTTNTLSVRILSTITSTNGAASSNTIFRASVLAVNPTSSTDVRTGTFATAVSGTNTWTASTTGTNKVQSLSISLAGNTSGAQGGDLLLLKVERGAPEDTFGGAAAIVGLELEYAR